LAVALLVAGPLLAACSSDFDPGDIGDKLDFFHVNEKKKLPGERKELFPGGVPGVSQGIPPDLVKGYKPPETAAVVEEPKEEKPKPKPRVVHQAPRKPKPQQQAQQPKPQPQQAQQQPAWPEPQPQVQKQPQQTGTQWPASAPQQQTSPWPDAPPPNTFQR
jgi:hypothetical protein